MTIRFGAVREQLRRIGIVISKRGEMIRINYFGGLEATAYYTRDLEDALNQGMAMAQPPSTRR